MEDHVWDDWEDYAVYDFDDDVENRDYLHRERRQYKMKERTNIDKWDDTDFFARFRLQKTTVCQVLELIRTDLEYNDDRPRYIKPMTQLLIALRFYALGSMQISVADFSGVSQSSVSIILAKVTNAICRHAAEFIKMPSTQEEMLEASQSFFEIASFPRVIGAIDCTHIKIQSPGGEIGENYRNRKSWFSFNVQTVSSAELKIISIVARWPGAAHDTTIFNNSRLKTRLEQGDFGAFIIVGDSGYRNTHYLATPLLKVETCIEALYNESKIRTRNVVERSYGVLKRRFPVLSMGMRVKLETVKQIIIACAILHNIAIDEHENVPPIVIEGFAEALVATTMPRRNKIQNASDNDARRSIRSQLIENYFAPLWEEAVAANPQFEEEEDIHFNNVLGAMD